MFLELLACFRTVKSSDSFPPASLPNYVSLGSGELSIFCVPQKNMSLAGLELPMVSESAEPTSDSSKIQSDSG